MKEYLIKTDAEFRIVDGKLIAVHDGSGVHVSSFKILPPHGQLKDVDAIKNKIKNWSLSRGDEYFSLQVRSTVVEAMLDCVPVFLEPTEASTKEEQHEF